MLAPISLPSYNLIVQVGAATTGIKLACAALRRWVDDVKTLICDTTGQVRLAEVEKPVIGEGELLLRVNACGVCGTDTLKIYSPEIGKPVLIGHEIAASVEESRTPDFKTGDRVVVAHHAPCYVCHYCRHGNYSMCETFKKTNISPGGFSEFVRVPAYLVAQTTIRMSDELDDDRAVFAEPLACCVRALKRVPPLQLGDSVAVVGAGSMGMLFLALLRLQRIRVAMFDLREDRLQTAREWGATVAINPENAYTGEAAKSISEGRGVDLVILTVANPDTFKQAIIMVRDGGSILIFGAKLNGEPAPADLWEIYRRELTIHSSYSATPQAFHEAMSLLHYLPLEALVSHHVSLADASSGMELSYRQEALKVVINP